MAIVFTSWTAGTEGARTYTLDWTSANTLKGDYGYPYYAALGQALNERIAFCERSYYGSPAIGPIAAYVAGSDAYDWCVIFDNKMDALMLNHAAGTYGAWVEYTDSGGDWDGDSITEIPHISAGTAALTWQAMIDWLIGEGVFPLGTTKIIAARGELSREWAWQRYAVLDAMRWYTIDEETITLEGLLSSKTRYEQVEDNNTTSWADAVSNFNAASPSSESSSSFDSWHYADRYYDDGTGDEDWTIRRSYHDVNLANIATNIAHQLVWYKYANFPFNSRASGEIEVYADTDNATAEDTLTIVHTSTVAATATRSLTIGATGNNTQSEPAKPNGTTENNSVRGYQYAASTTGGPYYLTLWKLDVTGGLTFVT